MDIRLHLKTHSGRQPQQIQYTCIELTKIVYSLQMFAILM